MQARISQRLAALAPSATLAVMDRARKLRESGVHVVSFGAGEPDFDTPAGIRDAAVKALAAGDTRYPSPVSGITPLRTAVCEYLQATCGLSYSPGQICATVGAKDALFLAFAALLDPGDEVIVPVPYWVSYPDQVRLCGGTPVFVHASDGDRLTVTASEIAALLTPRTRALVLNSPSNPSGAVYSRAALAEIADLLRGRDILVISDEIYHRLLFSDEPYCSFASLPGMVGQTLTVNGVSKTFAMTGWRLGFAAGPEWLISAMTKLQGQTTSGPASFVQTAAATALRSPALEVHEMCAAYKRRGARMAERLNTMPGVRCAAPQGAFYCFPDVSKAIARLGLKSADEFADAVLDKAQVAIVSGTPFGSPAHVRLSYATSDEQIEEGLRRIERFLA